ncbi:MAG: endonuclease VII domain-containing protein [Micrococcaceae bacterium]|nr:endonuclease VII domain-containing protein [Micrococcaceae bacterium]
MSHAVITEKKCSTCQEVKPFSDFNRRAKGSFGLQARCRNCQNASQAKYRQKHRETLNRKAVKYQNSNPDRRRSNHLKNRYGITLEEKDALLEAQGGRCAICDDGDVYMWVVDHDHACCPGQKSCGECIRSILCNRCNTMLGSARDDPRRLQSAIEYLSRHSQCDMEISV